MGSREHEIGWLCRAVAERSGVARVASLQREGHSRHRISAALASGTLRRVRRDWVALPTADPELVAAATHAVVLTCITQARRLGLWVRVEDRPHVAAARHSGGGKPATACVHWAEPLGPRHPDALVDPVENVLALVAVCQSTEDALAVWESALRAELTTIDLLRRLPLTGRARALAEEAWAFADSGLETIFRTRLRWLRLRILTQTWIHGHRVDFLIGDRLVVQIDGATHTGAQRTSDIRHDADLALLGYHVIRVGYHQVMDDWPAVQELILRAVGAGLHRAR